MHKVHLVKGHVVYVYWIYTVHVKNNLPTEFSKRTIFIKYENTPTCKKSSWYLGDDISISYMYNAKSDHFSPEIKLCIHGNRKSNAKS